MFLMYLARMFSPALARILLPALFWPENGRSNKGKVVGGSEIMPTNNYAHQIVHSFVTQATSKHGATKLHFLNLNIISKSSKKLFLIKSGKVFFFNT